MAPTAWATWAYGGVVADEYPCPRCGHPMATGVGTTGTDAQGTHYGDGYIKVCPPPCCLMYGLGPDGSLTPLVATDGADDELYF